MRTSHLFAFGSNPFGKACPGVAEIIVGDPVDILTALMEGTEEDIEAIDQIQGAWHKTLIGLRNSEYVSFDYKAAKRFLITHEHEKSQEDCYIGV